jgi:Fe-Mn family superoxide dismutase
MAFKLPDLQYDFAALEPHIDARTMEIHYGKHHAAYVAKLNAALEKHPELSQKPVEELLRSLDTLPAEIRTAVRNHGGGHFNHSLFWKVMAPGAGGSPSGVLATVVDRSFNGFAGFREQFSNAAANQFGSGWAWLVVDASKKLSVVTTPN